MFSKLSILVAVLHSLSTAAFQPYTAAGGNVILANRCPYDIWVQHVNGKNVTGLFHVPKRSVFVKPKEYSEAYCGVSFKVFNKPDIWIPEEGKYAAHTQFEYNVHPDQKKMYYDLSYIDCVDQSGNKKDASRCPGHERGHAIDSANRHCQPYVCKGGEYCPSQAYYVPIPDQDPDINMAQPVRDCGDQGYVMDITFKMCNDEPRLFKRGLAGRIYIGEGI